MVRRLEAFVQYMQLYSISKLNVTVWSYKNSFIAYKVAALGGPLVTYENYKNGIQNIFDAAS